MLKENLSLSQLFAIIIGFNLGTTLVVVLGITAKEDAWITVLLSTIIGLIVSSFFLHINELVPSKNLFEIIEFGFNRFMAIPITLVYSLYFFYLAARTIRDFGELTSTFILPLTPIEIIVITLMLIIGYILYLGIEILGRTTEIFTPYSAVFLFLLIIFLFASGNLSITKIQPVLARGILPVVKAIFPIEVSRPYGEMLVMTCIFPLITNVKWRKKSILASVAVSGFLLAIATLIIILSLGINTSSRATFPLLSTTRLISIGEFIERIDALAVFIIILGIVIKSSIFIYSGLKGLEYIFKQPYRFYVVPIICLISMFSIFISMEINDYVREGAVVVPYLLYIPLQFAFPCYLLFILLIKKVKSHNNP
ncbi:spore gernimation protein KC [Niallia circulans]|uniref:Spore gernimation protein KC n=1 Tax=Niallia circulans TaxID=1397 RepID=A0AA91TSB9_NIACI|nr:GerAB/ArcD/ProY family transporter [Niallia circulans]PAD83368.1 spore gernimation protein KC [Niallia circulans]